MLPQFQDVLFLQKRLQQARAYSPGSAQAELRVLTGGKVKTVSVELSTPARLVPVHIKNRPPSYFIFAGLVFTQVPQPCTASAGRCLSAAIAAQCIQ